MEQRRGRRPNPAINVERLRAALEESGRSQENPALELGVETSTVGRWLSGENRPDKNVVTRIAAILKRK